MLVLCLAAVLAISTGDEAGQYCTFKLTPDSMISGGTVLFEGDPTFVNGDLGACDDFCWPNADCQSFDYDLRNNVCRWFKTQSGLQPRKGIDHYDKICPARDVVSNPGNPQCFKTNYQGPVTDLWAAPNGVTWNFQIAHFGFDWPQSGIASLPLSKFVFIEEISFKSSDNLDYFRVVITQNNGKTITTKAIGPNDYSTALAGANDVKRVDFYLVAVDFRRNVSLNDINLKACTGFDSLRDCTIFNLIKDPVQKASLGIIKPGGTSGTFSVSVAQEYPFVELDLICAGLGNVSFSDVIFDGAQNFKFVVVNVSIGETAVPIPEGDTFSNPQDIKFANRISGNRIRSTIIPSGAPNQGIWGSIAFLKYSILASYF